MNPYFIIALIGLAIPVVFYAIARIRPNNVVGPILTGTTLPAAYSSREIWQKANEKAVRIMSVFGPILSIISLLFYRKPVSLTTGGPYLGFGLLTVGIVMFIYLYFYCERALREKAAGKSPVAAEANGTAGASRINAVLLLLISIAFAILGILEISGHPGTQTAAQNTVRVISGIGYIGIGAFFTGRLSRFLSRTENTTAFEREAICFIAVLLLWTALFAIISTYRV